MASILGSHFTHRATYYSVPPCDDQGTITASGQRVRFGVVASNFIPLHTLLRFDKPIHGRRFFRVLDTGAPFDVWLPCTARFAHTRSTWTNPTIGYRVVKG
jgi:hypothetical protein